MRLGSQVVDVRNEKFFHSMVEVSLWKLNINRSFQFAKEIKQILKGPAERIFKLKYKIYVFQFPNKCFRYIKVLPKNKSPGDDNSAVLGRNNST